MLIITDIDRLDRNADDVILAFKNLNANGIRVIALDTPYVNEWNKIQSNILYNMIADIFITLKAHMTQQEREKTITIINQELSVAKYQGTVLGRAKVKLPKDFVNEYSKFLTGYYRPMSSQNFAKMLGIGRSILYTI